ncbi:nucleotidyltransferase domain-containing protein [Candidatus Woesearchaeota archaeon]|nr:nucleotidyltransferase domain-containing protein [Candidatus Woesearchaeota archaeon]
MKKTLVSKKKRPLDEETTTARILRVIFYSPDIEFTLTELSQLAEVSKSTASRIVRTLSEGNIVNLVDKGIVFRIRGKVESPEYIKRKIVHNLSIIFDSGIVEFLEDMFNHPKAVILFGSFRKGEDISTSDIDIAIETDEKIDIEQVRPKGIEEYERFFLKRTIQVHLFNRKKVDINVFNSIANGIVLSGFLEVKP